MKSAYKQSPKKHLATVTGLNYSAAEIKIRMKQVHPEIFGRSFYFADPSVRSDIMTARRRDAICKIFDTIDENHISFETVGIVVNTTGESVRKFRNKCKAGAAK